MKRRFLLYALAILFILTGCAGKGEQSGATAITSLAQLNEAGRRIGVPTGARSDEVARVRFPQAEIIQYASLGDGFIAVQTGKLDGFCFSKNILQFVVNQNTNLTLIDDPMGECELAIGIRLDNTALASEINAIIKIFHENGLRAEMEERWLGSDPNPAMPEIEPAANPSRIITVGVSNAETPMAYLDSMGNPIGFDVEYAIRLCKELNAEVKFITMDWTALIPSLQSGKIDFIISNINITEERKLSVLFSDIYATTDIVMMVRKNPQEGVESTVFSPDDFSGKTFAVVTGSTGDSILDENIPDAKYSYYNTVTETVVALMQGKADAVLTSIALVERFSAAYPELKMLYPPITDVDVALMFAQGNTSLRESFNDFLREIKGNGIYDDMVQRWMFSVDYPEMPEISTSRKNGKLVFATSGTSDVFSIVQNGEPAGFEVEMAKRFAEYAEMELEINLMDHAGLIPAVQSGRADFGGDNFSITEERKKAVAFSDPIFRGGYMVTVHKENLSSESMSFIENLKISIHRNLILENRWKLIVEGLGNSLIITIFAFILATIFGFGVCGLRMHKSHILNAIGKFYITILRGTPIVVLLMIVFYVIFAKSNISGITVAIIAFGANGAAFISENIRSAILTIDKGQVEAARSMGFGKVGAFLTVTFPQAARVAFPVYMSEFISMFRMTSVVGYIAIMDLTKAGDIIRSRTYDAFFPLIFVALVYLIVASVIIWIFGKIENMTNKRLRRREK